HPTPAHAAGHATIANRLPRRARQPVGERELPLFLFRDNERTGEAGLHRMEVPELPPPDLVHPDPFPRGAHEHHLLRHMPEGPDALASTLEALRGPGTRVRPAAAASPVGRPPGDGPRSSAAARRSSESSAAAGTLVPPRSRSPAMSRRNPRTSSSAAESRRSASTMPDATAS